MQVEFVPYQEALELKALGFDEPCYKYIYIGDTGINVDHYLEVEPSKARNYNEDSLCISQPTLSQAFRWFREMHGLYHSITPTPNPVEYFGHVGTIDNHYLARFSDNFEKVEIACLRELINIVKSKH